MRRSRLQRIAALPSLPTPVVLAVALASYGGILVGVLAGWEPLGVVASGAVPWVLVLGREVGWAHRRHGWLALLYVLFLAQAAHLLEHLAWAATADPGGDLTGPVGDVAHVLWLAGLALGLVALSAPYHDNRWLRVGVGVTALHGAEHAVLVLDGVLSGPWQRGLFADGGALWGGLPIGAPALHALLAAGGTVAIAAAVGVTVRGERNAWLGRALAGPEPEVLVDVTDRAEVLSLRAGDVLMEQGAPADAFYVVSRGTLEVLRDDTGTTRRVALLGPGSMVGETGLLEERPRNATVRAATAAEVVRIDRPTFTDLLARSDEAAAEVREVARRRAVGSV